MARKIKPKPQEEDAALYQIMEAALRHLEDTADERPSLEEVAKKIGYSPSHFQRLFSAWVGVSPKKYVSYLAVGQAKRLLSERHTTLETADLAGLSSGGRLYDLMMSWEAMSPGAYAAKGEGVEIRYGFADSPFGDALIMATSKGICGIGFTADCGREAALKDLAGRWPKAEFKLDAEDAAAWGRLAFGAGSGDREGRLALIGAPFQIKVWEALLQVPSGHVTTYSDIAAAIGSPNAVRAVGTAVGRNPISWLIPCHRALRKSGELGGYHWGLTVKRAMLAYESARAEASL